LTIISYKENMKIF